MDMDTDVEEPVVKTEMARSNADAQINHEAAIAYWSSQPASDDGVLGKFSVAAGKGRFTRCLLTTRPVTLL